MKIGTQLQLAIANMDKQVELAKNVGGELAMESKEVKKEVKEAMKGEADGALGNNVDVEA